MNGAGNVLCLLGAVFMVWGTLYLGKSVPVMVRLHALGVADTLGAILVVVGLMFKYPGKLFSLLMAFMALLFWGPMVTYLIARGVGLKTDSEEGKEI